jgi:hypothetical protein
LPILDSRNPKCADIVYAQKSKIQNLKSKIVKAGKLPVNRV